MMKIWLRKIGVICFRTFLLLVATVATIYAADYFLSLAKVDFIPFIKWPESNLNQGAMGNAIAAGAGIFAAYGALCTFALTYWQKERHNLLSLEQTRKQHEYDAIAREFSELSDDFAQNSQLARINAAINLARIGRMADPRREPLEPKKATVENQTLQYPWFRAAAMQMAAALSTYVEPITLNQVRTAVRELRDFASKEVVPVIAQMPKKEFDTKLEEWTKIDPQPMLTFLISCLADANRTALYNFQGALLNAEAHLIGKEFDDSAETLSSIAKFTEDLSNNTEIVARQLELPRLAENRKAVSNLRLGTRSEAFKITQETSLKLCHTRDSLSDCLDGYVRKALPLIDDEKIFELSPSVILTGINLRGCFLVGADFAEACLHGCDLSGSYLSYADLSEARLECVDLSEANLDRSILKGARLNCSKLYESSITNAYCESVNLERTSLVGTRFKNSNLTGSRIRYASVVGTNFEEADMRWAKLAGANVVGADFWQAKLFHVDWLDENSCNMSLTKGWGRADFRGYEYFISARDEVAMPWVDEKGIRWLRQEFPYDDMDNDLLGSGVWPEGLKPFWEEGQAGEVEGRGDVPKDEGSSS